MFDSRVGIELLLDCVESWAIVELDFVVLVVAVVVVVVVAVVRDEVSIDKDVVRMGSSELN
ncbi:MAG: hypothetical protein JNN26_27670 [Candidatus Obscuribacter sp.]|nr:hypothetical protein [Candidatus Obscuribacter sp.]